MALASLSEADEDEERDEDEVLHEAGEEPGEGEVKRRILSSSTSRSSDAVSNMHVTLYFTNLTVRRLYGIASFYNTTTDGSGGSRLHQT
jgi:hypothetical protein